MKQPKIHIGKLPTGTYKQIEGHYISKKYRSPEYESYRNMLSRCYNPNDTSYKYYGAKGIGVCVRWVSSFKKFLNDMGPRLEGTSIDRIDTEGHYFPTNCRWADKQTQLMNTKHNKYKNKLGPNFWKRKANKE